MTFKGLTKRNVQFIAVYRTFIARYATRKPPLYECVSVARLLLCYPPVVSVAHISPVESAGVAACQSHPSPNLNSAHLRRITSQYLGSSSIVRHTREVCSQAISVEPDPPKVSRTILPRWLELRMRYTSISVGFMVGCTSFFFGFWNSITVVWERSPNHSCPAPSFHPYRQGSWIHW